MYDCVEGTLAHTTGLLSSSFHIGDLELGTMEKGMKKESELAVKGRERQLPW